MRLLFTIYVTLLAAVGAYGQISTSGQDFWLSFGGNLPCTDISFQVRIVATKNTQANITLTQTGEVIPLSLSANTVYTWDLTHAQRLAVYSDAKGASSKSIHIKTDENVSVYAINLMMSTTDATIVLPVNALGNSYYHLSYRPVMNDGYTIVAVENNTTVYEDGVVTAVLNEGEVFSSYFSIDGSGKHITSSRPIAYFVTNPGVFIPLGVYASDWLYQQLYAESLWGSRFFVPVSIRGIERVRVIASQDNTTISLTGGTLITGSLTLNAGQWAEIEITTVQNGCYIETNNPVGVASYLTGMLYPGLSYSQGDPSMTWIPPIEQSIDEMLIAPFLASGSSILTEHHLLIVAPTSAKNLTEIKQGDGSYAALTGGAWHDHSSGYSYYTLPLGNLDVSYSLKNPEGLIILGYGLGNAESYYYVASSATRKLDAYFEINGIYYQSLNGERFCNRKVVVNAIVKYQMNAAPGHLRWLIDGVEQTSFADNLYWTKELTEGSHTILMIAKGKSGELDSLTTSFVTGEKKETIINDTICQNEPYNKNGFSLPAQTISGRFQRNMSTAQNCDSIVYLRLHVNPVYQTEYHARVKVNEPYDQYGFYILPQKSTGQYDYKQSFSTRHSGCDSLVLLRLTVFNEIYPDKFFTPYSGQNEYWEIKNIEQNDYDLISIYDRFGKLIRKYETGEFTPWDGKYLDKIMPSTDYWYVIYLRDGRKYMGHFTLYR